MKLVAAKKETVEKIQLNLIKIQVKEKKINQRKIQINQ